MKLKRMFSSVGTLAMLMSVVFLISGCKSQTQSNQRGSEQVTISYSTERGTAPASKTVDKDYKLKAGDLPSLSATGFLFEGWYIEGTKATVGYTVTKSITLIAKWKDKITISYSTEHGTAPASKTVDKDYKLTAEDLPNISATNLVFEGWYIEGTKVTVGYTVTKSITLTAKWKDKITISYSTEHGTAPASKTVDEGYTLTQEDLPNISATNLVFEGWYIEGTKATVGYAVSKSITLTAKWKDKITISYSTEHGTAPASKTVDEGYTLTQEDLPNISATNLVFEGWYVEGVKATVGYAVTKSITLVAKWSIVSGKAMITYSTEHGTAPQSKVVDEGYQLKAEDLAPISADGFKFEGWYVDGAMATVGYTVTKIITLTAKWTVSEKVTISYSTEHGTAPASKIVDKGYKLTQEDLPTISATGFTFEGWYFNNIRISVGDVININATLTAKWIAIPQKVTITYSTAHGTAPQPKTVDKGHKLTEGDLNPISATGFIFEAWYIIAENREATIGYSVNNDITLTAKWQTASGETVTISYSTEHGTAPASKTVDKDYKLTAEDLPPLSADGFIFNGWHVGETKVNLGYVVDKSITLTAKWTEPQYVSFTTSRSVGETISLGVDAKPEDRPYVWIDLNNNGIREDGEGVSGFGYDITYTIVNQTFRLYGKITRLLCEKNDMTSIDFKSCTELQTISCAESQLTSFDLSGCPALSDLACSNLRLATLNLKDLKKLYRIQIMYCEITSFNINACTALETIYLWYNHIVGFDVSGCTKIKDFQCNYNEITSLDVRDSALKYIQCLWGKLASISVTDCTTIEKLICPGNDVESIKLKGCTALKILACPRNKLRTLDVGDCKALRILDCSNNQLTSLDVSQNTNLLSIWVYHNKMEGENMNALIASLPTFSPTAQNSNGVFVIIDSVGTPAEHENKYTTQNINDAKAKNWKVYDRKGKNDSAVEL